MNASFKKSVFMRLAVRGAWLAGGGRRASYRVGDSAELRKAFTPDDVRKFAEITLDDNPLHLDPQYARTTRFGRCIVHGVLINGLLSAVCATKLPGPGGIYLSHNLEFPAPLYVGEEVAAKVEITKVLKRVLVVKTTAVATERNKIVFQGEARILVPEKRED